MAYALQSPRDVSNHHRELWDETTTAAEVEALYGRTLKDDMDEYLPDGSLILEAGCGLGGWVSYLASKGHDVYGVDFEPTTVEQVNAEDPSLNISVGDVASLDFPDEYFDAYVSLGVVEHFEEGPQVALSEAFRVLKPGGVALITVPMLNLFRRLFSHPLRDLYFAIQTRRGKVTPHFWEYRYSAREMEGFLRDSGFAILKTDIDDFKPELSDRHIGLYADFFFLRDRRAAGYGLNLAGRVVRRLVKWFPEATSAGVLVVARKPTSDSK